MKQNLIGEEFAYAILKFHCSWDWQMGSGTVAKMSIINKRNWIGSEISSEYCEIIDECIKKSMEEKK